MVTINGNPQQGVISNFLVGCTLLCIEVLSFSNAQPKFGWLISYHFKGLERKKRTTGETKSLSRYAIREAHLQCTYHDKGVV